MDQETQPSAVLPGQRVNKFITDPLLFHAQGGEVSASFSPQTTQDVCRMSRLSFRSTLWASLETRCSLRASPLPLPRDKKMFGTKICIEFAPVLRQQHKTSRSTRQNPQQHNINNAGTRSSPSPCFVFASLPPSPHEGRRRTTTCP